jgi:hypothetical protein
MKVGYPDTINSSAYKQVSPLKARYTSSGEGMGDLKAVEIEKGSLAKKEDPSAKKQDPLTNYNDTPINMITPPLKDREMSAKRIARRDERVERINAKANSIAEQAYLKGVADEDLPTTAKKKYDRLTKKADRISAKTTKSPGDAKSDFAPPKKSSRLSKRVDRLDEKLEKSGVKKTKDGNYTGDSRREIRLRKQDRKAGAAAGYGNMDEAKSTAKLDKTLAKKGYKIKEIKSPAKFASAAQRKAVWASKNEKKKK